MLDGKNYATWESDVKLWLESWVDHLTVKRTNVAFDDFFRWKRIEAYLYMATKNTIHSSLKAMFRAYGTCYEVWEHAKLLYTNDTQRPYGSCHDLFDVVAPRTRNTMAEYLGKMNTLFHEFNEVLPSAFTPAEEIEQRLKFFMVLTLHGLADKYSHVCDQILGSPVIPNFTSHCSTLWCVPFNPSKDTPGSTTDSLLRHLNMMIAIALTSQAKGVTSVTIVAS